MKQARDRAMKQLAYKAPQPAAPKLQASKREEEKCDEECVHEWKSQRHGSSTAAKMCAKGYHIDCTSCSFCKNDGEDQKEKKWYDWEAEFERRIKLEHAEFERRQTVQRELRAAEQKKRDEMEKSDEAEHKRRMAAEGAEQSALDKMEDDRQRFENDFFQKQQKTAQKLYKEWTSEDE